MTERNERTGLGTRLPVLLNAHGNYRNRCSDSGFLVLFGTMIAGFLSAHPGWVN